MSFQAMNWVSGLRDVPGLQKSILFLLANYADERWSCFPSHARLAQESGWSDRAVREALKYLQENGLIEQVKQSRPDGGQTTNRVVLLAPLALRATPSGTERPTPRHQAPPHKEPLKEPSIEPTPPTPPGGRGCRLPEDWKPNPDDWERARDQWGLTTETLTTQTEEFRDYWIGVPGERGRKCDWDATWRNSMRRFKERTRINGKPLESGKRAPGVLPSGRLEFKAPLPRISQEEWRKQRANGKTQTGAPLPNGETEAKAGNHASLPPRVRHSEPPA